MGSDTVPKRKKWTIQYVYKFMIIHWHIFDSKCFKLICNIKQRLGCKYSSQNEFNAKKLPHPPKKNTPKNKPNKNKQTKQKTLC